MTLVISKVFTYDADAATYIQAVETADAQALEPATRQAINNFVVCCKQDGIWTAIKASCILAGARTLSGALVPLVGAAPTNVGPFVSGDYNRKTGLLGNGSKLLNPNYSMSSSLISDNHASVFLAALPNIAVSHLLGAQDSSLTNGYYGIETANSGGYYFGNWSSNQIRATRPNANTLVAQNRSSSTSIVVRINNVTTAYSHSVTGTPASSLSFRVFSRGNQADIANARLAFYSIGESLDLAKLDSRVTDLINAFAVTIP